MKVFITSIKDGFKISYGNGMFDLIKKDFLEDAIKRLNESGHEVILRIIPVDKYFNR